MKTLGKIILVLLTTSFHQSAFASGVYKCLGSDGEMTFAFAPCAAAETAPIVVIEEEAEPQFARGEELFRVDAEIQSVQDKLNRMKKEYEDSLLTITGNNTDTLTAEFDYASTDLLIQLNQLRSQRAQIARR